MATMENEKDENQTFEIEKPSTNPLTGLRGFMSFHIMMHHFFFYSPLNLNLMGAVELPIFFILSGFGLTLGYGKKDYKAIDLCCGKFESEEKQGEGGRFKFWTFLRNRFA